MIELTVFIMFFAILVIVLFVSGWYDIPFNLFPYVDSDLERRLSVTEELRKLQAELKDKRLDNRPGFVKDQEKLAKDWEKVWGMPLGKSVALTEEDQKYLEIESADKVQVAHSEIKGVKVIIIRKSPE